MSALSPRSAAHTSSALVFVTLGCGGSAASTPATVADGVPVGDCLTQAPAAATLASLDARCFGGPNGRDLLNLVGVSYTSTLTSPQEIFSPTPLTVTFAYGGAPVTCTAIEQPAWDPPGPGAAGPACSGYLPQIETTLDVMFRTEDGLFNEVFTAQATFGGLEPGVSGAGLVTIEATVPATALKGTYPSKSGDPTSEYDFAAEVEGSGTSQGWVAEPSGTELAIWGQAQTE